MFYLYLIKYFRMSVNSYSIKDLTLRLNRLAWNFFFSFSIAIIQSTIDFVNPRRDLVSGTRARTIGGWRLARERVKSASVAVHRDFRPRQLFDAVAGQMVDILGIFSGLGRTRPIIKNAPKTTPSRTNYDDQNGACSSLADRPKETCRKARHSAKGLWREREIQRDREKEKAREKYDDGRGRRRELEGKKKKESGRGRGEREKREEKIRAKDGDAGCAVGKKRQTRGRIKPVEQWWVSWKEPTVREERETCFNPETRRPYQKLFSQTLFVQYSQAFPGNSREIRQPLVFDSTEKQVRDDIEFREWNTFSNSSSLKKGALFKFL